MNVIVCISMLISLGTNNIDSCESHYIDFLLNKGVPLHSYFLNICIKDKRGKTYDVVVTNYDLFQIVNQERNLDLEQYNKLIKKTISSSNPFALKKELKDYDGGVFLLYKNDNNVKSIAKKGKDYFIKYYLGPADERGGPSAEDVNIAAIIKELIKWHVPVKSGDDGAFYSADLHFKCDN